MTAYSPTHHITADLFKSSLIIITNCTRVEILGDQTLDTALNLTNASDLYLTGHGHSTRITCTNVGGIYFISSLRISITNLSFVSCSMNVSDLVDPQVKKTIFPLLSSMMFYGGGGIEVSGCSFTDSIGSSLLLVNVDGVTIERSLFKGSNSATDVNVHKTGGIVIRQLHQYELHTSYRITECTFVENHAVSQTLICPISTFEPYDKDVYSGYGGAIDIRLNTRNSSTDITVLASQFARNRARHGGAVSLAFGGTNSSNTLNLTACTFDSNTGCIQGGAVVVFSDTFLKDVDPSNTATLHIDSCNFTKNVAFWSGGVSVFRCHTCGELLLFANRSTWDSNTALTSGYAVGIGGNHTSTDPGNHYEITGFHARASFHDCVFVRNSNKGLYRNINAIGALYVTACDLQLSGNTTFDSNFGTALLMNGLSRATFADDIIFSDNFGVSGGAMYVMDGSQIKFNSPAKVLFSGNKAMVSGGAIYSKPINEVYGNPPVPCLFQLESLKNVNVTFVDNTASDSDQAVFVGNPDECNQFQYFILNIFTYIPDVKNQIQTVSTNVSFRTIPEMINGTLSVMLGESFYLDPVVVDRFEHNSTSFGYLTLLLENYEFADTANFTLVGPTSIGADNFTKNNVFYITGPDNDNTTEFVLEFWYEQLSTYRSGNSLVPLSIVSCRLGYAYSNTTRKCECATGKDNNIICSRESNATRVCIKKGYWYDEDTKQTVPCPTTNCEYANGECPNKTEPCPMSPGYCSIVHADDVCWVGRTGFLCSQCKPDYGFSFGALGCSPAHTCRPRNTILLMLGVLAYWFIFIAVLLVILTFNNISVGSGFMYGLIYYFSVATVLADVSINNVFLRYLISACVSMTQLDPRIIVQFLPICFAKQMNDGLHHLMLRYVTPLFIICVILSIIWLSRSRFCRIPKRISLSENSPIHAICILILFSYTYLSHTNFQILRPMVIDGKVKVAASPTVDYFDPKHHLPYALFALGIELFISLPICILFLFAPCLSKRVNLVKLKLLPILDEFQACYHTKYRWFAGYYFLARQLIYLASIIPQSDLPQMNLLLPILSTAILLVHCAFQPYKKHWLNILDTIFLTDIVLFSAYTILTANPPQVSGLNWFFYESTPFVLIFIPTGYLIGVLAALLFKRIWNWVKSLRQHCSRHSRGTAESNPNYPMSSEVTVHRDSLSSSGSAALPHQSNPFTDSFFRDYGEREPLLADMRATDFGNIRSNDGGSESEGITHNSIELVHPEIRP